MTGADFHPGMGITFTAPSGKTLVSSALVNVMPSSFQVYAAFEESGTWSVAAMNVGGQLGQEFKFVVP